MDQVLTEETMSGDVAKSAPAPPAAVISAKAQERNARVRDIMAPPVGVYRGSATVAETTEALREATRTAFITYCYITDEDNRLEGLVAAE